jgi:type IV secretory pathway VirB4 component
MGMVGSGKSYKSKLELLRSKLVYDGLQIVVVDPKQEYRRVVKACGGSYEELDEETVVEFDNDVVGYTVPERGDKKNVEFLVDAVRQIYQKVSQDTRKTLVLIDEARILLNDEHGLDILNQFVLEGRDTNTAVTLVTQNASHFTHSRKGREILDNVPAKEFMRHDRVPDSVVKYFDLSNREKQELYELETGRESRYSEALVRVSGQLKTRVKVESTSKEHVLIDSPEVEA